MRRPERQPAFSRAIQRLASVSARRPTFPAPADETQCARLAWFEMRIPITIIALAAMVSLTAASDPGNPEESDQCCHLALPSALQERVLHDYPGFRLVLRRDLVPYHRELWDSGPGGCPGVAHVDLDGDGRADYGINLISDLDEPPSGVLIAAFASDGGWRMLELGRFGQSVPAALRAQPDCNVEYRSFEGDSPVPFDAGALLLVGYESWSRVFGFVNGEVASVQTSE